MAFEETNRIIEKYGEDKLRQAQSDGRGMGISHRRNSSSSSDSLSGMKVSFSRRMGDIISVIRYSLRRNLFYTYHGAGRGHGGKKGSTWFRGDERRKTNPASLGKAGTGSRQAKPFLDTITRDADAMIDNAAASMMDEIFNTAFKKGK